MKKYFGKTALLLLLLAFILPLVSGCGGSSEPVTLTIIHINDTHGRTYAEPYISQMAKDLRAAGGNVLIFDAGDRLHGQIATNLTEGETMVEIMNAVGYDAMVTGNHEYTFGMERLSELSGMMNFPLLAANVRAADGSYPFERYKVFTLDRLTVGVFGIATPETVAASDPRVMIGLIFEDPAETAAAMAEILQSEKCDIIIALTHLGSANITAQNERSDAVAAVAGVNLVIDGHCHTLLESGRMVGDTLIVQAGEYGQHIGIVEITFENGAITGNTARVVVVPTEDGENDLPYDEAVVTQIAEGEARVEVITSVVVGHTPVRLTGERQTIRTGDTNLTNLITDSMLHATGADISFISAGSIRASIEAGDITMGDVLTVLPYANLVVTVELKGSEIWEILEHGVSLYPEPEGQFLQTGGLRFTFDPGLEPGNRVQSAELINGGALNPDAVYTVATIEYMAAGGDGYTMFGNAENLIYYGGDAEAFVRYLETTPVITAESDGRVTTVESEAVQDAA